MSVSPRLATNLAAGATLAGALLLGGLWIGDRLHRWERPHWKPASFVPLRAAAPADHDTAATWAMPVNPRCPRCVRTLRRFHARWSGRGGTAELIVLLVDMPTHPTARDLRAIPPIAIWWDRDGVWRRRWGHRLYGEVLQFDAAGAYLRSVPADQALGSAPPPVERATSAPVTSERGGM